MQMTGRARYIVKQYGRPSGLISFLCDEAIRGWDFRPGYQQTRRIIDGDRLNDGSLFNNEIDQCPSASKVLQLLLTNGEASDYSWWSTHKKCWFEFKRRIPPESVTEEASECKVFLSLGMNTAVKRKRDGKNNRGYHWSWQTISRVTKSCGGRPRATRALLV